MDSDSFAKELFERYSDMVYRIAVSYGKDIYIAEEVVQEVFLRYLRKKPHFESSEHEKAWFIRVAVNCCKSMLNTAWAKHMTPLEDVGQAVDFFRQKEESELFEMLLELPTKYRIVLYLRYYEEYQVKEIAKLLGLTPNLVSARLLRAKKLMKQKFLEQKLFMDMEGIGNETGNI